MSMDEMHWATAHRDFHGGSGRGVRDKRAPEAVAKPPTDIPVRCFVLRRQLWQDPKIQEGPGADAPQR